jgi:hypothetical protein
MQFFKNVTAKRAPWNKGKLIGQKPPLRLKHVWAIRTTLQLEGRIRDLALFNLAIDSKLRGCDVVSLKVEDVAPHSYAIDRAQSAKRKREDLLNLKYPNRHAKRLMTTSIRRAKHQVTFCSLGIEAKNVV